jgi:hypothetical protein
VDVHAESYADELEVELEEIMLADFNAALEDESPHEVCISETNSDRQLVLSGMQNRTSGPYLADIDRILISRMVGPGQKSCEAFEYLPATSLRRPCHRPAGDGRLAVYERECGTVSMPDSQTSSRLMTWQELPDQVGSQVC